MWFSGAMDVVAQWCYGFCGVLVQRTVVKWMLFYKEILWCSGAMRCCGAMFFLYNDLLWCNGLLCLNGLLWCSDVMCFLWCSDVIWWCGKIGCCGAVMRHGAKLPVASTGLSLLLNQILGLK